MKILVINGPNLNLLGIREPGIYGKSGYDALVEKITSAGKEMGLDVECFQSNHEGAIIDKIHETLNGYDGIVMNPGAFTHYSYAILDALKSVGIPTVEVHISNIHQREEFRHKSVTAAACCGQICGLGQYGYIAALGYLKERLSEHAG